MSFNRKKRQLIILSVLFAIILLLIMICIIISFNKCSSDSADTADTAASSEPVVQTTTMPEKYIIDENVKVIKQDDLKAG